MRIIAGEYGGRILKGPAGNKTRPTSDRLRETLFNILTPSIDEATRFLDLCCGTGAVGIEALSRGAASAVFVDQSRRACALVEENLDLLQIAEDRTSVIMMAAETFAARKFETGWDIIFFDPPYEFEYSLVLSELDREDSMLPPDGIFIAEHHQKKLLPDAIGNVRRWRIVKQGETNLSFYEKR